MIKFFSLGCVCVCLFKIFHTGLGCTLGWPQTFQIAPGFSVFTSAVLELQVLYHRGPRLPILLVKRKDSKVRERKNLQICQFYNFKMDLDYLLLRKGMLVCMSSYISVILWIMLLILKTCFYFHFFKMCISVLALYCVCLLPSEVRGGHWISWN